MKIRNLFPALAALCSVAIWVETNCAAATNTLQIQPFAATIYTTNFTGNFNNPSPPNPFTVGSSPESVAAADVNGDGKVDLISADNDSGTLTVLTNDGTGNFVIASTLLLANSPTAVIAVDVNGDGKVDLICVGKGPSVLTVLTNDGDGTFTVASSPAVGGIPNSVAAAVIDGSSKLSLICANESDNTLTVLTNMGGGIFASNASYTVGGHPTCVVTADINNNGNVDLISANEFDNNLTVLTNNGSGIFGSNATLNVSVSVAPNPISIVAFTNVDGKVDLVTANIADNTLTVLTNNGSGHFSIATILGTGDGVGNRPFAVTAADVNNDGKMDLICANLSDNTLTVLTNDGSGGFVFASLPSTGDEPYSVVAADVDGDGALDLIDADYDDGTLTVNYDLPTLIPYTVSGIGIFWSTNSAGFVLQQNTNLNDTASWVNVSTAPMLTNGLNLVTAPFIDSGQLFYRLRHP